MHLTSIAHITSFENTYFGMCNIRCILLLLSISFSLQVDWHFSGQNIALSRPTYQKPRTRNGGVPSRAVDNDTNIYWRGGSCTHTYGSRNSANSAFWNVTFEMPYNLSGIRIYNRNTLRDRLRNFKVFGVHENTEETELYDDTHYSRYKKEVIPIELNGQHAYIGINITIPRRYHNILTLCEVQIYAVKCKRFHVQNNTIVIPNKEFYEENATITITCDQGYEPYPNYSTVSCEAKGWDREAPLCKPITCDLPKMPNNGYYITDRSKEGVVDNSSIFYFKSAIIGKCDTGFESNNENLLRVCQVDKTWSGEDITCKILTCHFPREFSNGRYILDNLNITYRDTTEYGTILNVTCDTGYVLIGEYQRKCSENHTWTGTEPMCNKVKCEYPGNILNGYYSAISISDTNSTLYTQGALDYLSELLVNCTTGHYLRSGSKLRQCLESGIWSGDSPVCVPIMCEWPLHLEGGYYEPSNNATPEGLPYDTVLTAFCFEMYNLSDNYEPRRCNEQHRWDKTPAVCDTLCLLPNITNGRYANAVSAQYVIGTVHNFMCNPGYTEADDRKNITCQENHTWSAVPECLAIPEEEDTAADNAGLIGGLSAVFVVVLATAGILLLYFQRYHKECGRQYISFSKTENQAKPTYNTDMNNLENKGKNIIAAKGCQREGPVYTNTMFDEFTDIEQSDQTYYNLPADRDKIPETAFYVEDLVEFILSGDKAKDKMEKQFEILPKGMTEQHSIAIKPQNKGKNRYRDLYAYDASRVVLDTDNSTESDYINACYVHGFTKRQKYIASQGPTKEILVDFWRMVWQSNSNRIVMLTSLIEEKKVKCEQYWPDTGSCIYGRITVMLKSSEKFPQFVVRTLTIKKDNIAKREIMQFHFTAWPDKGVPKYSSSLIQLLQKVNESPLQGKGPIIVHCSAGVGRTGTYIAVDYLMDQAKGLGYVDVVGSVKALRKQRVNLVQTMDQYMFLHHALAESFMLSTKAIPASEFPQTFSRLLQVERDKGKSTLTLEFEAMRKMSRLADEMNRRRGSYLNTRPADKCMPILPTVSGSGNWSYASPIFLPGYKNKKYFIVTQTPVEETRAQFWRMIWDNDIHTVVMMNNRKETTVQEKYWPNGGKTVSFGNIMITTKCTEGMNEHHVKTLWVQNKDVVSSLLSVRQIRQFQCGGWQLHKTLPDSPRAILSLMELIQTWQQETGNHPILVHCMNGVNKSGLYCAISAVIERMKVEQAVAISHVIDEMRNASGHIIPSAEQFQFCHEAVLAYIEQYSTYSNFFS